MVYTAVNQVLVVSPCGADGLHSAVDQVLVVNPCGANGLHSVVDQVLVVNPCGADVSYPANTKHFLTCFKKSYESVLQH